MMKITLNKPPALNHLYATNKFGGKYLTAKGKAYKDEIGWKVKEAKLKPIEGQVRLVAKLYTCRHQDNDGILKILQDSLQSAGVIADDYWIFDLRITKEIVHTLAEERVELEMEAIK